jgi:hypothetical protein
LFAALNVCGFVPFLFAKDVAVKLVRFHVDRWNIADSGIVESGTLLANGFEDAQNGVLVKSGQPACGSDADTLTKQPDNIINLLGFDSQAVQRLRL